MAPIHSQSDSNFTGLKAVLKSMYDVVNKNVFTNNLNGVELEWSNKLKSRMAISYKHDTLTYMRFSEQNLKNCSRKQLLEVLLCEMLHVFIVLQNYGEIDNDIQVYLLKAAMSHLNSNFGVNLALNYNICAYDACHVNDIKDLLSEKGEWNSNYMLVEQNCKPKMKILTKILLEKNQEKFKCQKKCSPCNCDPCVIYRKYFSNVKVFATYSMQCLMCQNEIKQNAFNEHINKCCDILKTF